MSKFREWDLSCKVYVGNLGSASSKYEIERIFCKYGSIKNVWVARNPPGFAFVEFEDGRDAEDSVRGLDGTRVCGSRIRVEMSSGRTRRDGGRRCQWPVSIITTTTNYITTTSTTNLPHLLLHNRLPTSMAIRSTLLQPTTDSANRSTTPQIKSTGTVSTIHTVNETAIVSSARLPFDSTVRNNIDALNVSSSVKLLICRAIINLHLENFFRFNILLTEKTSADLSTPLRVDHPIFSPG